VSRTTKTAVPAELDPFDPGHHVLPGCAIDEDPGQVPLNLPSDLIIVETRHHDVVGAIRSSRFVLLLLRITPDTEIGATPAEQCFPLNDLLRALGGVGGLLPLAGGG